MRRTINNMGYSLLEVLVATAILAIGLLAIFGLVQSARQRSLDASDLAAVELAVQTTLNELLAKQNPMEPIPLRPIAGVRNWKLEVQFYDSPRPDMATIFLNAQKLTPQGDLPVGISFQLVRWVPKHRVRLMETPSDPFLESTPTSEFDDPYTLQRQ